MSTCPDKVASSASKLTFLWLLTWLLAVLLLAVLPISAWSGDTFSSNAANHTGGYSTPAFSYVATSLDFSSSQSNSLQTAQQFFQDNVRTSVQHNHYNPSERDRLVHVLKTRSFCEYATVLNSLRYQRRITDQEILSLHELYCYGAFMQYIQTLPGFDDYMLVLHKEAQSGKRGEKAVAKRIGYSRNMAMALLDTHAARINRARQEQAIKVRAENEKQAKIVAQQRAEQVAKACEEKKRIAEERALQAELAAQQEKERQQAVARTTAIEEYRCKDIAEACMVMFEGRMGEDRCCVASTLDALAQDTFAGAQMCDYQIAPEVITYISQAVDTIPTTDNQYLFAVKLVMFEHLLQDVQHWAMSHAQVLPAAFDRSRELFTRAVCTFVSQLNPITQAKGLAHLIVDTARFVSTVSVGSYYLAPEEYQSRIAGYWGTLEAFAPENLAKLSAEQWVDLAAHCAADMVFCMGVAKGAKYIKQLNAAVRASEHAATVAKRFRKVAQNIMKEQRAAATSEGVLLRMSEGAGGVGDGAKKVGGGKKVFDDGRKAAKVNKCANGTYEVPKRIHEWERGVDCSISKDWKSVQQQYQSPFARTGYRELEDKVISIKHRHILGPESSVSRKGNLCYGGGHHDLMHSMEAENIYQLVNKQHYAGGFYEAEIWHEGGYVTDKTFYPAHYTRPQVLETIFKVYDDCKAMDVPILWGPDGKGWLEGFTKEGIKLGMYITKNGVITTAYPVFK